jgi:hypothetical protein
MATPVREWLRDNADRNDDSLNMEQYRKLREAVKGKTCETIMKNKKVCGRPYYIHPTGFCGCRFHEDYSHALRALNVLEDPDHPDNKS